MRSAPQTGTRARGITLTLGSAAILAGGCLPYTVGSTARTVAPGKTVAQTSFYAIPNAVERFGDSVSVPQFGFDNEVRRGVNERTDIGFRIPQLSGFIVNMKRRMDRGDGPVAVAWMAGGGIVNVGSHAMGEASLLVSKSAMSEYMPFGGLRMLAVLPISQGAVSDSPSIGGFVGLRMGDLDFAITPEIGVYRDPSALGFRRTKVIVVPAITISGERILDRLRGGLLRVMTAQARR